MKGVTPANPLDSQPASLDEPESSDRDHAVF